MAKIIVNDKKKGEMVLLDTENLPAIFALNHLSLRLRDYGKCDEALILLQAIKDPSPKVSMLMQKLEKISKDLNKPKIVETMPRLTLDSMSGLRCYRVGADAGAGFKDSDNIDVLGTEGLCTCVAIMIETKDTDGMNCYYLGHIHGDRADTPKKSGTVEEELDRILVDLRLLTGKSTLSWIDLEEDDDLITLVGNESDLVRRTPDSKLYKRLESIFINQYHLTPDILFSNKAAIDLRKGAFQLINIRHKGGLHEGVENTVPFVKHGEHSPLLIDQSQSLTNSTPHKSKRNEVKIETKFSTSPNMMFSNPLAGISIDPLLLKENMKKILLEADSLPPVMQTALVTLLKKLPIAQLSELRHLSSCSQQAYDEFCALVPINHNI